MTDIGKVISGLEKTASHFRSVINAQRENGRYISVSFKEYENACINAVEFLKEKKPTKPIHKHVYTTKGWYCGVCDKRLNREGKYCCFCGTPVDWDIT